MKTDNRKTTATVCKKPAARKTSSSGKRRQAGTIATLTGSDDIYRLVTDRIIVTLEIHELVHASGHAKRLNREGITRASKKFGDPVYAFEELIA